MKLKLVCTSDGFRVADDNDYEQKRKLKKGAVYECTIKEVRNVKFHRLYFALINCAWSFLTESQQEFFRNDSETFRKTVEVCAGHYEPCYSVSRREWIEVPRSIAFDKLDETSFSELYEKIKDVIYQLFIVPERRDEFEQQLRFF